MNTKYIITILLLSFTLSAYSQIFEAQQNELKKNLSYLADDNLKGRASGTKEDKIAADFIASKLSEYGFKPFLGVNAVVPFEFTKYRETGFGSLLSVGGTVLLEGVEFCVPPISANGEVKGKLAFINKTDQTGSLQGKILVIESSLDSIPFKVTAIRDKGVMAILFYSASLNLDRKSVSSGTSLPVAQISRETLAKISDLAGKEVVFKTVVNIVKGLSYNIVMNLSNKDYKESILIGAHYDHLGMGGAGSGSMNPAINAIHNGADDNASGVSSIMEIGRILFKHKENLKRNIIIVAFGGEEKGLLGSKIIADTLQKLNLLPVMMLNLDMVGRLADNKLQAGGVGTFSQADSIVKYANKDFNFKMTFTQDGYGPSDHSSFYSVKVPVLYFTTGIHKQYHTPSDDIELINFAGLDSLTNFFTTLTYNLATSAEVPSYIKTTSATSPTRASFKVTLGLIPDFTYEVGDGFKAGSVTDGKPAQIGGMQTGDLITAINNKKVSNIYDYMARLGELKAGDKIEVTVKRDGKTLTISIQL